MTPAELMLAMRSSLPNVAGFSWRDLLGIDKWEYLDQTIIAFTTQFPVMTIVGTPVYKLKWNVRGKQCFFQVEFSSSTSVATTAGTSYMLLPVTASVAGVGAQGQMSNRTANTGSGQAVIDYVNSRLYFPTIAATANVMSGGGWYEV